MAGLDRLIETNPAGSVVDPAAWSPKTDPPVAIWKVPARPGYLDFQPDRVTWTSSQTGLLGLGDFVQEVSVCPKIPEPVEQEVQRCDGLR